MSVPKALQAGPVRLRLAVSPRSISKSEWREYPGQFETLKELTGRTSSPRALPVRISNTPAATGEYRMVKVGEKVGPAKILSRTFSYGI
jgi:hypothetical protein